MPMFRLKQVLRYIIQQARQSSIGLEVRILGTIKVFR